MENLIELLGKAEFILATEEEKYAYNNNPQIISRFKELDERIKELPDLNEISIGDYYSRYAHCHWNNEKDDCIEEISDYIKSGETVSSSIILGFIVAWVNSEIRHPKVEELVKHTMKHDLLKYPLTTTVNDYVNLSRKKPNHRPTKHPIHYLDTLMTYFEIRTVNGTGNRLGISNKSVREHLTKLVGVDEDFGILIDEQFKYYTAIQKAYFKWLAHKEKNSIDLIGDK
ncbi:MULTISPECIES: hypothetical protein [unclassified Colwellia]|uniref:hypothetical protein n=1 Tax=unclassified Colwellia TaxID=196834 RepID=UPI0015F36057|nr:MULTISPECIES: hypothetical protein [unclassified Colwellia]MBA6233142.1 hypothetical protein [Colwellia sp. MB02u-7]MBA6236232.1 hypothetical protein [Colwellia sp. MB02u-11]MBA6298368.1 hypothetical protein [Colwellia sp. MB3u-22]MBA6311807.1 hypothetical protein [Colwellia sp. MB3u-64]